MVENLQTAPSFLVENGLTGWLAGWLFPCCKLKAIRFTLSVLPLLMLWLLLLGDNFAFLLYFQSYTLRHGTHFVCSVVVVVVEALVVVPLGGQKGEEEESSREKKIDDFASQAKSSWSKRGCCLIRTCLPVSKLQFKVAMVADLVLRSELRSLSQN